MLSGISIVDSLTAEKAAAAIAGLGVKTVILTLGREGALVWHDQKFSRIPAPEVMALDTTAAGDVFNGALAVALSEGRPMLEAVDFACKAAALSVTRMGAQSSIPVRSEIEGPNAISMAAVREKAMA